MIFSLHNNYFLFLVWPPGSGFNIKKFTVINRKEYALQSLFGSSAYSIEWGVDKEKINSSDYVSIPSLSYEGFNNYTPMTMCPVKALAAKVSTTTAHQ